VRSNQDGSQPEAIHVHHVAPGQLAVMKAVSRCTRAALVTATIDEASGEASSITGGQLGRNGSQLAFAFLRFDPAASRLTARAELPGGQLELATEVGTRPWHLYDFDLASLNVWLAGRAEKARAFRFGLPLLLVAESGPKLADLGTVEAQPLGWVRRRGAAALHFALTGPALAGGRGALWTDARTGHIIEVRLPMPNHDGYRDFRLALTGVEHGAEAWARTRARHWQGCPPA
jgi:hypothetical protein